MEIREPKIQDDQELARLCLAGDRHAQESLYTACLPRLTRLLQSRGAGLHDAEALAADVLSECLYGYDDREPRLTQFSGRSSLSTWISQVAINRYIDFVRRKKPLSDGEPEDEDFTDPPPPLEEQAVLALVKEALVFAFRQCDAMDFVLLQLVHGHLVDQRQVARLFGWSDSKLSRKLAAARESVRKSALAHLRSRDAHLAVGWEELIQVAFQLSDPADS